MSIESKRLISLIEFAQQTALLRTKPITDIVRHQIFHKFQHNFLGLPGIHILSSDEENRDESWIVINRLQEEAPPVPTSDLLRVWLDINKSSLKEPSLRLQIQSKDLAEIVDYSDDLPLDPSQVIYLHSSPIRDEVHKLLQTYLDNEWKPWLLSENLRRQTIAIYSDLFSLRQQLVDGIANAAMELVLGVGMAVWNVSGTRICYPLITKVVELSLNQINMDIEIRPCDTAPQIELDLYSFLDNLGILDLDKKIKEFAEPLSQNFFPFDQRTFEEVLKSVATYLDPTGVYESSLEALENGSLPIASEKLQVTNSWVLFARSRSINAFIQDLECFKKKLKEAEVDLNLPPAVTSLVTDPSDSLEVDISLPAYRGLSEVSEYNDVLKDIQNLYFPKPFNEEQVRIVQMLEVNDGVVVQGPPGTGKTHTIANIICHYLALGKRVLVTSMKEPALAVLRGQLPSELQPLVISLLSEEQDGLKQLEHTVSKMIAEIQRLDRQTLNKDIRKIEADIDATHASIAKIDRQVKAWAIQNLSPIRLEDEVLFPIDAANEVINGLESISWFQDLISVESKYNPQFSDSDILQLREARRTLSTDLSYVGCQIPSLEGLPDSRAIKDLHNEFVRLTTLKTELLIEPSKEFIIITQETVELAQQLGSKLKIQLALIRKIKNVNVNWIDTITVRVQQDEGDEILQLFQELGQECRNFFEDRKKFLARPITIPEGVEHQTKLSQAIENLSQNKRPFGLISVFVEKEIKDSLSKIRIGADSPTTVDDWLYVREYLFRLKRMRELLVRWNILAEELGLSIYPNDLSYISEAVKTFEIYEEIKKIVNGSQELVEFVKRIFPLCEELTLNWMDEPTLVEFDKAIGEQLEVYYLNRAYVRRNQIINALQGNSGSVVVKMQEFLNIVLGNPSCSNELVKEQWDNLLEELMRVHKLTPIMDIVLEVCSLIEASGAIQWAKQLSIIPVTSIDDLLPTNWSEIWRLKRLATHLQAIDVGDEINCLKKIRDELELNLRRNYGQVVEKRAWLKIIENATPSIRSALTGYVAAILRIGKDKGKRAPRYRHEARNAAARAFSAIPCWIMPHHRISQSLPAEFGCFDLVIIDEASQSDLSALPCMLRAQKVLIVGDDKQVSPEGVGIEEEEVKRLRSRFLSEQVELFRPHMTPECSIYDLFKVVFAKSTIMLKEHFRSVAPIIEYSKREFYNHELKPLRVAKSLERLDPPLIDILVEDGFRKGNINPAEIRCIVEEIKAIVQDPKMSSRSIGIVSLLADEQAYKIWKSLEEEIGLEAMQRHQIACGDARTFQGKERDIIFLTMVVCPKSATAVTKRNFAQRFNVAASRARDRMYLVRSVSLHDLSEADYFRKKLIEHFSVPFAKNEIRVDNLRDLCESPFEKEVYNLLTERGYHVTPQVPVGGFRIDMVVEGANGKRLAIECDGDRYHGPEQWDDDMRRQRVLERAGWRFWRCFASTFVLQKQQVVEDLLMTLENLSISPIGVVSEVASIHTESRRYNAFSKSVDHLIEAVHQIDKNF